MYNGTVIRFGVSGFRNNRGLCTASADNGYLDLDCSGYHKPHVSRSDNCILFWNFQYTFETSKLGSEKFKIAETK